MHPFSSICIHLHPSQSITIHHHPSLSICIYPKWCCPTAAQEPAHSLWCDRHSGRLNWISPQQAAVYARASAPITGQMGQLGSRQPRCIPFDGVCGKHHQRCWCWISAICRNCFQPLPNSGAAPASGMWHLGFLNSKLNIPRYVESFRCAWYYFKWCLLWQLIAIVVAHITFTSARVLA